MLLVALLIAGCGFGATTVQASTGAFANAFATPDWKYARFAVSGSATPCGGGYCSYFPTVTAVPALPEYQTCRNVALDSDPNTQVAWKGETATANAAFAADVPKASILNGVYGQRLCLSLIGTREVKDAVCEAQSKVWEEFFGEPGWPCPPIKVTFEEPVASTLLSVEPPPPPTALPVPVTPPSATPKAKPKKCPKGKRAIRKKGKRVCVKRKNKAQKKRSAKNSRGAKKAAERYGLPN